MIRPDRIVGVNPRLLLPRLRQLAGEHKLFTGALAVGALLRLLAMLGYPGALWFAGDSYVYVGAALRPQPNLSKSTGYSFFLRLLLPFHSFTLVTGRAAPDGPCRRGDDLRPAPAQRRVQDMVGGGHAAAAPRRVHHRGRAPDHGGDRCSRSCSWSRCCCSCGGPGPPGGRRWSPGLLVGAAAVVRTEGAVMLAVLPLFLLLRGWAWKTLRGWAVASCSRWRR